MLPIRQSLINFYCLHPHLFDKTVLSYAELKGMPNIRILRQTSAAQPR